jgi:tetratricopeptide (TPR) repeat protein
MGNVTADRVYGGQPGLTNTLQSKTKILLALAGAIIAIGLAWWTLTDRLPAPPQPDLGGREPQVAEKISRLREAVVADRDNAEVWGRLGSMFQVSGLPTDAIECYRVANQLSPGDFRWPYLSGYALQDDDPERALSYFDSAAELNNSYPALYFRRGDVYLRLGRLEDASADYQRSLDLEPRSSHARLGLARVALLEQRPRDALPLLEAAMRLRPRHWEVGRALAQTHTALGNEAEAARLNALDRPGQVATEPDDPVVAAMWQEAVDSNAMLIRGAEALFAGRLDEAVDTFRGVVTLRPDSSEHHRWLADAYAASGRTADAMKSYETALSIDPESIPALLGLGANQLAAGQPDTAAVTLERAVAAGANEPTAYFLLGSAHEADGNPPAAATAYRQATELEPNLIPAWSGLARVLGEQEPDAALAAWQRVVTLAPADPVARGQLAAGLIRSGDHASAIRVLTEGLQQGPADPNNARLLAWELATAPDPALRNGAEARRLAEYAFSRRAGDPLFADTLAAALAEAGEFADAATLATTALDLAPADGGDLKTAIAARRELYLAGKPYRQNAAADR